MILYSYIVVVFFTMLWYSNLIPLIQALLGDLLCEMAQLMCLGSLELRSRLSCDMYLYLMSTFFFKSKAIFSISSMFPLALNFTDDRSAVKNLFMLLVDHTLLFHFLLMFVVTQFKSADCCCVICIMYLHTVT